MTQFKKLVAQHLDDGFSMQTFCSMEAGSDRKFLSDLKSKLEALNAPPAPKATLAGIYWASLGATDTKAYRTRRKRTLNSHTAQQLLEKKDVVMEDLQAMIEVEIEDRLFEIMPPEEFSYTYWLKNL